MPPAYTIHSVLKGNITTACIDFGLSKLNFQEDCDRLAYARLIVVVCLAVLFMQKRDERRARASTADTVSEELVDDVDSKAKLSVDRASEN